MTYIVIYAVIILLLIVGNKRYWDVQHKKEEGLR